MKKRTKGESVPSPNGTQVEVWQPMSKPSNLPEEAVVLIPGTIVQVMGKDGKQKQKDGKPVTREVRGLQIRLPKVAAVMAAKGLTESQARDRIALSARRLSLLSVAG